MRDTHKVSGSGLTLLAGLLAPLAALAGDGGSITFSPDANAVPAAGGPALAVLAGLLALLGVQAARQRRATGLVLCLALGAAMAGSGSFQLVQESRALVLNTPVDNPSGQTLRISDSNEVFQNVSGVPLAVTDLTTSCVQESTGPSFTQCAVGVRMEDGDTCAVNLDCRLQESDRRLKTDLRVVGATVHGLALYEFRYRGRAGVYEGVMAQDVLAVMPEAVVKGSNGYYAVNYDLLGAPFRRVR